MKVKKKLLCYILSFIGVFSFFGVCFKDAPVWWYTLCIAIGFLCLFLVNYIDPQFFLEKDKQGNTIE